MGEYCINTRCKYNQWHGGYDKNCIKTRKDENYVQKCNKVKLKEIHLSENLTMVTESDKYYG